MTILADKTTVAQMHNELRDTPKTGDDSKPWLWAALMGVSAMGAAALGVAAYVGKRKRTTIPQNNGGLNLCKEE